MNSYEDNPAFEMINYSVCNTKLSKGLGFIRFQEILFKNGPEEKPELKDEFVILADQVLNGVPA